MRFDNQILAASINLRRCLKEHDWASPLVDDNKDGEGVLISTRRKFEERLLRGITVQTFTKTKVIAWRNKTVDRYNKMIREALGFKSKFVIGDVLLLGGPVEINGRIEGNTDDEGVVLAVEKSRVNISGRNIPVYVLLLDMGDVRIKVQVVKEGAAELDELLNKKAERAKLASGSSRRKMWKEFWDIKKQFHNVRYGYALTAHRAQGSTYDRAFVDQEDILYNSNKREAFRCLYVACTRPTTCLYSF
jgi:hypothetical protein